ncbi:MAG: adenylyl-sulfate kinase [Bacteroidota bacterium]|nr:adenylyl-sulfate kinase [Bacteroidota bacterium]
MNNIFPTEKILQRADKQQLLGQQGVAVWFTGLSGSGKTTIAVALEKELNKQGFLTQVLDGDNIRAGINNNLGFSESERMENIRRIAEITKLFVNCGVITICCFVSPTSEIRAIAKSIIGEKDLVEVFVNTPIAICEQRDVKGLYAKARKGEILDFTGVNAPFEPPANPDIELKSLTVEESVQLLISKLKLKKR